MPRNRPSRTARGWEIGGSLALLLAVCFGCGFFLHRRHLDFALIDAAAKRDVQAGLRALAAGANPNARGAPDEKGLPRLVAILGFPEKKSSQPLVRSALSLTEDDALQEELFLALLRRGAVPEGPEKYLPAAVEPLLAKHSLHRLEVGNFEEDCFAPVDDEILCRRVLARFPVCGRAELALGETLLQAGEYQKARDALRRAMERLPNDPLAAAMLRLADRQLAVTTAIQRFLPRPQNVAYLRRFPTPIGTSPMWVALIREYDPEKGGFPGRSGLHLSLWKGSKTELRPCGDAPLKGPHASGSFTSFQLRDLTGDGIPEAAVLCGIHGLGNAPSYFWIFTVKKTRLVQKLALYGGEPPWTKDLNSDGVPEILTRYEIGVEPSHVEQPRWVDTYRWKNGYYVDANLDFPKEVLDNDGAIQYGLAHYPDDWELWKYRGVTRAVQRRRGKARSAFRRALRLLAEQKASTPTERTHYEEERREIRNRLSALMQRRE